MNGVLSCTDRTLFPHKGFPCGMSGLNIAGAFRMNPRPRTDSPSPPPSNDNREQSRTAGEPETEIHHPAGTGAGAAIGATIGGVIGALGGPVGAFMGAAAGAIAGGNTGTKAAERANPVLHPDEEKAAESPDPKGALS